MTKPRFGLYWGKIEKDSDYDQRFISEDTYLRIRAQRAQILGHELNLTARDKDWLDRPIPRDYDPHERKRLASAIVLEQSREQ